MPSTSLTVPTRDELVASKAAYANSYNKLEAIEFQLQSWHDVASKHGAEAVPTIDDALVGRLYRYINVAEIEILQMSQTLAAVRDLVDILDGYGLDQEVRRGA